MGITKNDLLGIIQDDIFAGRFKYEYIGEDSFIMGDERPKCFDRYEEAGLDWDEFWAVLTKFAKDLRSC